ncbi:MurR/RpiR family transcriptional regulator [Halomonas sp. DWK9]|uniref:MurR/RpiR family transcriptional regulator n=1 Tax=Halomonadaceae TaxID=28256 RepID=UPI00287F8BD5|nr:MurR/RpiR family transcriptional regulator [Halomonas sp. DWK9]
MTPNIKERSFLNRVRSALPTLHPAERRLGEFVCDFPGELASYDAQELARFANVSKATVSRFVRRLGYESYEAARKHAREEQTTGSRLFLPSSAALHEEEHSLSSNLEQGKANLERTFSTITQAEIDDVAQAILGARKTWVIGFRASHPFADYLRWQLTQVVEEVTSLPGGGETLGEQLVNFTQDDCVIIFGLRRRVALTEQLLLHAKECGAKLLYITDEGLNADPTATWHFRCHTLASGPLFNHTAVMALCHLMVMRTIELAGDASRTRLRRIEALNDRFEEL